ncbi:hypothetical protein BC941DRAFT_464280 [Chlamydoabsidia padenii]|nr:hypothetical protein BC941DRAFT_464280 [Chlamydoabsidia padenii]
MTQQPSNWPSAKDDPFIQQAPINQDSPLSSWQEGQTTIPKWHLQTDEERIDQQKAIRAMESKLRRIKEQPNARNQYWRDNDLDSSDEDGERDDQEGLSLLWQQKYTHDEALIHQKDDRHYLPHTWVSWFACCCCSSPVD